ncbi:class A beta-lactamase [Tardiphaga alba]|uniref:Beta-lactamase n=1 Tax=Tardiphaga alba TaxID=340268 RepID=A0ABX8AAB9_9BRAD|nr:class A beta-lactamase [Tardiphaga alba]QUS39255.1 class A beta-lactamase [Tardiphaga alba]
MMIDRRTFLLTASAFAATPAFAKEAPAALLAYERDSGGRIGVYARNLTSGAELRWRDTDRFVMCSTFKASLAACVLSRVDHGKDQLDAMIPYTQKDLITHAPVAKENLAKGALSVGEMAKAIVEISDNTCANLLLARIGGPKALTAFWREHGDVTSRLDDYELELNRTPLGRIENTTTPRAMALSLEHLAIGDGLQPVSRAQFVEWLVNCKTGANRLRAGLPASWKIGDKTGNNGKDAAGDIAVAWPAPDRPVVIAAYTRGGKPTPAQIDAVFKAIGQLVGERLG